MATFLEERRILTLPHASAKADPASDPPAMRPEARAEFSASHASCAS